MFIPARETWNAIAAVRRWWDRSAKDRDVPKDTAPGEKSSAQVEPLRERMRALHLDPDEVLTSANPAVKDLQRLCARCESRGRCMRDLVDEFADPAWQAWRDYCPNATALSVLSTLHGCDEIEPKSA